WSHETGQSYQPSYPVSNGKVVVYGSYYGAPSKTRIVGLNDKTGDETWSVPTAQQNMSAACFAGDLVFVGSYDQHLYAIERKHGTFAWKLDCGGMVRSNPLVVNDLAFVIREDQRFGNSHDSGKTNKTLLVID